MTIDTTDIKIVVVKPLNKNFIFVNPSTLLGEIINHPNSWSVQEVSGINKSKKKQSILIKFPKKKQDLRVDLPTIGFKTLKQRFMENMTMKEIGSANGYSRETARRKLLKAVKICKEKNKIQIWFVYIE